MPMFLFSGTFYPLSSLPLALQWIGWISPLWHATQLGRWLSYGMPLEPWQGALSVTYLLAMGVVGIYVARRRFERRLTA
jgi:lipooligosaccharide transport system permease protein